MSHTSQRRSRAGLRRLAAAGAGAIAVLALAAAPAQAAAGITVDPKGPYTNGATVTVSGTGFAPGSTVVVGECKGTTAPASPQDCADESTGALVYTTADATGAVKATLTLVVGPIREGVTCSGSGCSIVAFALGDPTAVAVAPFGTSGAQATSVPSVSPTSGGSSTSPTATPSATSPSATPSATTAPPPRTNAAVPPGRRPGSNGSLAHTGPQEAVTIALVALVVGQLGLVLLVRALRRPRPRHA